MSSCTDQNCSKLLPVNHGTSVISEKIVSFYKNPREFLKKYKNDDRIFLCRFGMRPCLVVSSNALVKELLEKHCQDDKTYNGLKDFFFGLFGNNLMFAPDEQSQIMRKALIPLMQPDRFQTILEDLVSNWIIKELTTPDPVILYEKFKNFGTMFSLRCFLGIEDDFEEISKVATNHWHGIISVPMNVKVSFLMSSSYRKAMEAKSQLLDIIEERLESKSSDFLKEAFENSDDDRETFKNNILLFTCALIPKAVGSLLSSFMDTSILWYEKYVDSNGNISDEDLTNLIYEIIRLWPPFFGGLRVAQMDFCYGPYCVPKGYGIFYSNYSAHRDPNVFDNPDDFIPERWQNSNKNDTDKIFGFGAGSHRCIGENLMLHVLKYVAKNVIQNFSWTHLDNPMDRNIKCLPVLRPRELTPVILSRK